MDSARIPQGRRKCLRFALVAVMIAETGCAKLNVFHKPNGPAFGTETVEYSDSAQAVPGTGDLYASLMKKSRDAEPAKRLEESPRMLADGSRPPGDIARGTEPKLVTSTQPAVALQPPVSLSALPTEPSPKAVARHVEPITPVRLNGTLTPAKPEWAATPAPASNSTTSPPKDAALGTILAASRKAVDALSSYQVAMTHQERVGTILNPAEDVVMSIRRKPKAVRLEWPDGPNKGREVIYAADKANGQMQIKMANPLVPRLAMAPDSPLATRNSRHPITEAGFDTIIEGMEKAFAAQSKGDGRLGAMKYAGLQTPPGGSKPCQRIVRVSPTKETWEVYIDPTTHLPAYVVAKAANGDLLERHVFGKATLNPPALASAAAFDANARWGESTGLLSRLAGAAAAPEKETRTR